jgi:hypothetical protein
MDNKLLLWMNLINNKQILNIKLDDKLSKEYNNKTNLDYIISFDVEFLRYVVDHRQIQTIHEMGGLLFEKKSNSWYLICIFHINLKPIIQNINQYYLLTSKYNTLSDDVNDKVIKIENKLLLNNLFSNTQNMSITETKELLYKNKLLKRYLSKKNINKLLNIKSNDFDKFIKKLSKINHMIKGSDLINFKEEYNMFKDIINLILNDPTVIEREIKEKDQNLFINLTNELFSKSYLIVKGIEDIKALKNHSLLLKQESLKLTHIFDIAIYNNILYQKCNSAELENSFLCLQNLKLTQKYDSFLKIINDFTHLKPHNPLVDAYYTWIIFNIFLFN